MVELPPATEIFNLSDMAARHPRLLPKNRLLWAARNRRRNGLAAANAVFESPTGQLFFHEASTLAWLLGRAGRSKPRTTRRRAAAA